MTTLNALAHVDAASALALGVAASTAAVAVKVPHVKVRFAHFLHFDHTQSIIGLDQGWLEEVGSSFDPDPHGIVVQASEASAVLASGRVDVMSASAQLFLPAAKTLPPYKVFFYADIFQGLSWRSAATIRNPSKSSSRRECRPTTPFWPQWDS